MALSLKKPEYVTEDVGPFARKPGTVAEANGAFARFSNFPRQVVLLSLDCCYVLRKLSVS